MVARNVPLVSKEKIALNVLGGSKERVAKNVPIVFKVMNVNNALSVSREMVAKNVPLVSKVTIVNDVRRTIMEKTVVIIIFQSIHHGICCRPKPQYPNIIN